jgi:hypothetical protein
MYKERTVKKSDISIFFRAEKIRVGMEWPNLLKVKRIHGTTYVHPWGLFLTLFSLGIPQEKA